MSLENDDKFQKKCNYCDKEFLKNANIYYIYDNPTCSLFCQRNIHYTIYRVNPEFDKPELWTKTRNRSKSF
jgi:hypothetical protein